MIKLITTIIFIGMSLGILILAVQLNKYRKRDHVKENEIVKEIYSTVSTISEYYIDKNFKVYMYTEISEDFLINIIVDSTLNDILHDLHTIDNFRLGLVEYDEVECIIKTKVKQMLPNYLHKEPECDENDYEVVSMHDSSWNLSKVANELYNNDESSIF